jgi:hypothetical protein
VRFPEKAFHLSPVHDHAPGIVAGLVQS